MTFQISKSLFVPSRKVRVSALLEHHLLYRMSFITESDLLIQPFSFSTFSYDPFGDFSLERVAKT